MELKQMNLSERERWFLDRVGKRVWRNKISGFDNFYELGIIIYNKLQAIGMYYIEKKHINYSFPLKYFDTPSERDAFELTLKK